MPSGVNLGETKALTEAVKYVLEVIVDKKDQQIENGAMLLRRM